MAVAEAWTTLAAIAMATSWSVRYRTGRGAWLPAPPRRRAVGQPQRRRRSGSPRHPGSSRSGTCAGWTWRCDLARFVDPHQGERQRNGPWLLQQVGAGPFGGDLEQHPPGHVLDDLVAEIGAGGGLGDPHEGCHGTDLPGDQLTGTLPIQVHAGRGELPQEHVDLAVEPRTSRHAASLPSSRHGTRSEQRTGPPGNIRNDDWRWLTRAHSQPVTANERSIVPSGLHVARGPSIRAIYFTGIYGRIISLSSWSMMWQCHT